MWHLCIRMKDGSGKHFKLSSLSYAVGFLASYYGGHKKYIKGHLLYK